MIASTLVIAMGTAHAELSDIQKKVIADHQSMEGMTADQRREFRKEIFGGFNNTNKAAQRAYNQAYKAMVEANMLTKLSDVGKPTVGDKGNVASRAVGTMIQYDSGMIATSNQGQASQTVGNKFNTGWNPTAGASGALNPVLATGSITALTINMASVGGTAAFITVANGTGSGASLVSSVSVPLAAGTNTLTGAAFATSGPFLAGVWQPTGGADSANDVVGVATGTTNGQGFHGVSFNDIALTNFADIPSRNAVIRLQGQLLQDSVPVELMNFQVE